MECWNCKKGNMKEMEKLGRGWVECPLCGATYTNVPKRKQPIRIRKPDMAQGESYSPAGSAVVRREKI